MSVLGTTVAYAYYAGLRDGVRRFAWKNEGKWFVGTEGIPLDEALKEIDREEKQVRIEDEIQASEGDR